MLIQDVFIYHLDNELQKLFSLNRYENDSLYSIFKSITRVAFLLCKNRILVPASNYFESDIAFAILNELKELNEMGAISLISSSYNIDELIKKKNCQHGENFKLPNYHYLDFSGDTAKIILPGTLKKRNRSASSDIKSGWYSYINHSETKGLLASLSSDAITASKFEDMLYEVPQKLGNRAFISDYILPLLPINKAKTRNADYLLNAFITREYIASFLQEFNATCLKDIPIIDSNIILPYRSDDKESYISYSAISGKLKLLKYRNMSSLRFINDCNTYELIEFKYSNEWKSILEQLSYHVEDYNILLEGNNMHDYTDIKIGIITALPKECAAVRMMMYDVKEIFFEDKGSGHRFYVGKLNSANGGEHKVALGLCGMGNNKAAIRATNMLSHFKSMDSIIMTGIAGGIPSYQSDGKQVRLGDIVVSNHITQYDFTKETADLIEIRSNSASPSAQLLEAVNVLRIDEYDNKYPWHEYLDKFSLSNPQFAKPAPDTDKLYDLDNNLCEHPNDSTRTEYPKAFMGGIASANTLLKNPHKRDYLKERYGVLAVEMEASGIADATWEHEVGYLVVRGICDYCDTHKNDVWQEYAALVAAAYTRSLVESLPSF